MAVAVAKRFGQKQADRYVGEQKNQLRHGYGVYTYENHFFRYEGQWENGQKHGHGKLTLGDGGYYKGAFVRGEIEGHGYRVFGLSGSTYSGQFHRGEMHGQGLLRTVTGGQYEGSWMYGKKEGSGILTEENGSVYEGEFHDNKRHGEGVQIYANGDQYDGDWVAGDRHGHGLLRSVTGTIYDGQWRGGVYHGEGSILHASGVTYKGMWVNGRPAAEPVALRLEGTLSGSSEIIVEQGKSFGIHFACVDAKGEPAVLEGGRSFKVSAGIRKHSAPKHTTRTKSRLQLGSVPPTISEKPSQVIQTPFGYSVHAYELLQVPQTDSSAPTPASLSRPGTQATTASPPERDLKGDSSPPLQSRGEGDVLRSTSQGDLQDQTSAKVEDDQLRNTSTHELHSSHSSTTVDQQHSISLYPHSFALSRQETRSLTDMRKHQMEKGMTTKEEGFLAGLVPPSKSHTSEGKGVFKELFLPPPPIPDISHILSPSPSKRSLSPSPSKESVDKKATKKSPGSSRSSTPAHDHSASSSPSHSRKNVSHSGSSMKPSRSDSRSRSVEKEKLLQPKRERFCLPGTYILIVSEVTDPPFLGTRLPDLFIQVKVVTRKATKEVSLEKLLLRSKTQLKLSQK